MAKLKPIDALQLRVGLATGAAATTDMAVTATDGSTIALADILLFVLELTAAGAIESVDDRTSEASIVTAGSIQLSTTDSSSNQLLVFWHDSDVAP